MTDRILLSVDGGVAHVRLNRPDKLNALDPAMFTAIAEVIARLHAMREARCIVLSGEGRAFCAGLDMAGRRRRAITATRTCSSRSPGAGARCRSR
jgi:enoyl-CoA hydratase/carnithine racemase